MRKADTHFYFAGGFFGKYMNYGKEATEKKIDLIYSRKKKYTTRVFLTFFKTFLILCLFAVLVTSSIGIGIFMGILLGNIVSLAMKTSFVLPLSEMLMAFAITFAVGIISGYYPAKKASRLNPIEALRYE